MQVNELFFVGSNKYGQSGTGEKNNTKIFQTIKSYDFGIFIKQVSCGYHHSAFLTISGYVYTMGSNIHGTLGNKQEGLNYSFSPILVQSLPSINKIQSGAFHLCALSNNGNVYSWGRGMDGQLGNGSNKNSYIPEKIQLEEQIIDISCGTNHTIILSNQNKAYAFGNGIYGQLGTGNNKNQLKPKKIQNLEDVIMIAAGENHSLYLCGDVIYATGDNTSGQIGIGNTKKYVLQPQKVNLPNVSIIKAAKFSCAIASGELYVWGGPSKQFVPFLVQSDYNFTQIKAGNDIVMVLSSKGGLYNWRVSPKIDQQQLLKPFLIDSQTILDFSIGQSHIMILGDIIRTIDQAQNQQPLKVLKHYDKNSNSQQLPLRDLTSKSVNIQQKKSIVQNRSSLDPIKPYQRQNVFVNKSIQQISQRKSPLRNKKSIMNSYNQNINYSNINVQQKIQQLINETKICKKQFQQVKMFMQDVKNIQIDPEKNRFFLSKNNNKNAKNHPNLISDKNNILLLREKDLKISELQQQLSKKQAIIDAYDTTVNALNKVVQTQKNQIEFFENYINNNQK